MMQYFWLTVTLLTLSGCGKTTPSFLAANEATHLEDGFELEEDTAFLPTRSSDLATARIADPVTFKRLHPWPVSLLSIGHTMASYQNYGGSPYFHHGLDMRADAGSDVLASAGGKVVNIENYVLGNPAYWEVAILDDEGFLWQYHHVKRESIPEAIHTAYRTGEPIAAGTKLGEVYYWIIETFGERYHHIHVNILDADRAYLNPFAFLEPLDDRQAPQVLEMGILKNGRPYPGHEVSGQYTIYAKIHDLIMHDRFVVPPYEIKYSVDGAPFTSVWRFDRLPGGASNTQYVRNLFTESMTCGDYECRELTIDLGFRTAGANYFTQNTGAHAVEIEATDDFGNKVRQSFQWSVNQ